MLQACVPESPRDAWAWLAQRPGLAARAGVHHILAHSPSSRLHVLYLTAAQMGSIKCGTRVGVLCAWTDEFDSWHPGHEVVLEAGDMRQQYSLRGVRYFVTDEEMVQEMQGVLNSGMSVVADRPPHRESPDGDRSVSPVPEPSVSIPIPSRGRYRPPTVAYVGVLLELTPLTVCNPGDQIGN
jgi:hypothetical protein